MTSQLLSPYHLKTELLERSLSKTVEPIEKQHRYELISVHGDPSAQLGKDGAGGQNLYVKSLGLSLAKRGCKVDMFTRRESPDQAEIVDHSNGCRTIRLTAGPAKFIHRDELFPYLPEFIEDWLTFQKLSGLSYDLIHSISWQGVDFYFKKGKNERESLSFSRMIQLSFIDEAIKHLHYERFHHPHSRGQRKMEALYLKSQKYAHKEIAKLIRFSELTLLSYFRDYKVGGIAKLKELTFNRPQSEMKQHQESIEAYFREHPPRTFR